MAGLPAIRWLVRQFVSANSTSKARGFTARVPFLLAGAAGMVVAAAASAAVPPPFV
jgi:hypothetical protein